MIFKQSKTYPVRRLVESIKEYFPDLDIFRVDTYLTSQESWSIGRAEHSIGGTRFYHYRGCSVSVHKIIVDPSGPKSVELSVFSEDQEKARSIFNELEVVLLKDTTIKRS